MRLDRPSLEFVGVGAARSGTTWLSRALAEHPEIFLPARKELHYWGDDRAWDPSLTGLWPWFRQADPTALWGEFTPRYLIDPKALARIHDAFPRVKILISLRDPVERAWSQYCYFRYRKRKEPEADFARALAGRYHEDYVTKSQYHPQLAGVRELFEPDRVWLSLFARIATEPREVVRDLYRFLEVREDFVPSVLAQVVNDSRPTGEPPAPLTRALALLARPRDGRVQRLLRPLHWGASRINSWLDAQDGGGGRGAPELDAEQARSVYLQYFRDDVARTEELLGLDLSAWRRD